VQVITIWLSILLVCGLKSPDNGILIYLYLKEVDEQFFLATRIYDAVPVFLTSLCLSAQKYV